MENKMVYPEKIEIVWTVDDVLNLQAGIDEQSGMDVLYRDLGMTRQEAARVLHEVERHHDANLGVTRCQSGRKLGYAALLGRRTVRG